MTDTDFHARYADALRSYVMAGDESSLAVGHDLGRQALQDRISMLDIIENHHRLVFEFGPSSANAAAALQFLLQTLAPLDVATRGFLDGTKRYEQERARAENLADRDAFRTALVNSLQEGFFVAGRDGSVVEVNDAFADITGYSAEGLPYQWPHPWVVDQKAATERLAKLQREGAIEYELPIRHRRGHTVWVAVSMNSVTGADRDAYVGTIRDITAARAAAARDRETLLTLQRAMLAPTETPVGFAVRYEPAVPPLEIGGDWYDVLPVGERRIGIIVGDCVGRGLPAAAVMGQLRSSARALLLTGVEPALVLEQLDTVATLIPDAFCTTVMVAVFDTESRVLTYSRAGHVPPVLAAPHAEPIVLSEAGSVPLAVHRDHPRPQECTLLAPGSTLMMVTDGLVERRGERIDDGIARVASVLTKTMNSPVDEVAEVVLRDLAPVDGYDDDVAIVVCRPPLAPLRIEEDAWADRLAGVRHRLTAWLHGAGVADNVAGDVVLAVGEACSNSIEHGYRNLPRGKMRVEAEIGDDEVVVRVIDFGAWRTPPSDPGTRGRGLQLIDAVSSSAEVELNGQGTTVAMNFRRS
ncbi:MAG TPA: SpoIIE family protein phosphatase [Mycobacterium sp.]|nr:SpoIIE family protein phosphatase [Mycobacterium sp.]